jgi:hypothetical protein
MFVLVRSARHDKHGRPAYRGYTTIEGRRSKPHADVTVRRHNQLTWSVQPKEKSMR